MKLELRENMYIRNCYGRIAKIEYIEDNIAYCDNWLYQSYEDHITFINLNDEEDINEILKASYNIIDLIKSKDIILGRDGKIYQCWKTYKDYVFTYSKNKQGQTITLVDYQIDNILTKEQFKEMSYKIKENK